MTEEKQRQATTAAALVERAKSGDRRAFAELVRRYRQRIVALTLHLTGSESDAEDVTQEVFFKAYRALGSFQGRSEFFTWVYRMAVNRSLNAKRDKKRRNEALLEDPRIARAVRIDAGGDPARAAELRQTYEKLLWALDRLPNTMRTSVVLVALQGMNHGEAAVIQKCSPGTIAWRIHEARKRLRTAMESDRPRIPRTTPANGSTAATGDERERPSLSAELTALLQQLRLPAIPN